MGLFSEREVHQHLYNVGLESTIADCSYLEDFLRQDGDSEEGDEFELWKLIKRRALERLARLHSSVRYGEFVGSNVKLPTDNSRPMELDLIGTHEDGLFILELKVERSAERNAFSELFAYSNYVAGMFALSGPQDIANILVANLDNKITKQAFLYDLIICERDIVVYKPVFKSNQLSGLVLELFLPDDEDFRHFANQLLSHDAMGCAVISFHDLPGWFDREENEFRGVNDWTRKHLEALSGYTAQLMETEKLHGFCFVRRRWQEMPNSDVSSLFICAVNPFHIVEFNRANEIVDQLDESRLSDFFESPKLAFDGRLIRIAQRAINDCLTHDYDAEVEVPYWGAIVRSMTEVAFTHNLGFRPTGIMREAYVSFINTLYLPGEEGHDVSVLKINEVNNWLRAWMFMEGCGFDSGEAEAHD